MRRTELSWDYNILIWAISKYFGFNPPAGKYQDSWWAVVMSLEAHHLTGLASHSNAWCITRQGWDTAVLQPLQYLTVRGLTLKYVERFEVWDESSCRHGSELSGWSLSFDYHKLRDRISISSGIIFLHAANDLHNLSWCSGNLSITHQYKRTRILCESYLITHCCTHKPSSPP